MSFILDALKKSESDRQRQTGPALFEVKVAPPRTRLPSWAIAIAVLLVVNLGIVMWMLMRHSTHATAGDAAGSAGAATGAPLPVTSQPIAVPAAATVPPAVALPAVTQPAAAGAASAGVPAAAAAAVTPTPATAAATPGAAPAASAASAPAAGADAPSPEDYAPAAEPGSASLSSHVRRGTAAGVPLYQDAAATPGTQIPALRLDLHVYAALPQDRFVMINMRKLREGESLPEGVHVDSITPEGVVLSYRGSRFLLTQD
jgi:general secretion pathway protein B